MRPESVRWHNAPGRKARRAAGRATRHEPSTLHLSLAREALDMNLRNCLLLGWAMALMVPFAWGADSGADPVAGSWKLNAAKSTFGSGTVPKSETRVYTPTGQGIHVVIETEHADGKKEKNEVTLT